MMSSGPEFSQDIRRQQLSRQRRGLLRTLSSLLDTPMTMLAFVWVILMIVDFSGYQSHALEVAGSVIWMLFIAHFALEFWIAPHKLRYIKTNWLTAIALALPAFRMLRALRYLRVLRAAGVGRGVFLLRWVTSVNRGAKATRRALRRRGFVYVLALTLLIDFSGAAAMYVFENPLALQSGRLSESSQEGIHSYGEALWWTSMMMTTMGSDYFPKSTEGRLVALALAIYAFAIFGYITATVASLIIQADHKQAHSGAHHPPTTSQAEYIQSVLDQLQADVAKLRAAINGPAAQGPALEE